MYLYLKTVREIAAHLTTLPLPNFELKTLREIRAHMMTLPLPNRLQQHSALTFHHQIQSSNGFRRPLSVSFFRDRVPNSSLKSERKTVICKWQLLEDTPLAITIGACVLNSIAFPVRDQDNKDNDAGDGQSMEDMRYAAMGIISFVPFFNWLSWVFAWLDTGRQRYLAYSLVYLAPYISKLIFHPEFIEQRGQRRYGSGIGIRKLCALLNTNIHDRHYVILRSELSLLPDDSWLPISSIIVCILHIQLEISLKTGGLRDFELFEGHNAFLESLRQKDVLKKIGTHFDKLQGFKDKESRKDENAELEERDANLKSFVKERAARDKENIRNSLESSQVYDELPKHDETDSQ